VEPTPALSLGEADARLEFRLLARVKGTLTPSVVAGAGDEDEQQEGEEVAAEAEAEAEAEEGKAPMPKPQPPMQRQQRKQPPAVMVTEGVRAVLPCVGTPSAAFCRLLAGTEEHEEASLARDEGELRRVREEASGLGEAEWLPFIDEALAEVAERRRRYVARRGAPPDADASGRPLIPGATPAFVAAVAAAAASGHTPKKGRSASPPGSRGNRPRGYSGGENMAPNGAAPFEEAAAASLDGSSNSNSGGGGVREGKATPCSDPVSHFYQLRDGSYAFLHPLSMRCLMADAGGDSSRLPPRVSARAVEVEGVTLTPELRGRYGFLKHLPLYSQVQLVELELRPPLLSEATYQQFRPEMKKRQQRRRQREKAEARERKLAAMAAAAEGQGAVDWASLRGAGLTEEEIVAIQAQREEGVDLDGPLPWQAMLVADEADPEKRRERLEQLGQLGQGQGQDEGSAEEAAGASATGTSPPLVSSFAEITRRSGQHFPALGDEMFPALGSSPTSASSAGPLGASPPVWGAARGAGAATAGSACIGGDSNSGSSNSATSNSNPLLASSPPAGVWGRGSATASLSGLSGLGTTPPSSTSALAPSSSAPWASAAAVAASMRAGGGIGSNGSSNSAAAAAGRKKSKAKGTPIFSTGSQRSYV
jgi:hypothetical protein